MTLFRKDSHIALQMHLLKSTKSGMHNSQPMDRIQPQTLFYHQQQVKKYKKLLMNYGNL